MTDFEGQLGYESEEITEKEVNVLRLADMDSNTADLQVRTARAYPRNLKKALDNIKFICTDDKDVAESCFYTIKRDGKTIRGASIRFAEIVCACYGNIRASARVVANDGKTVTAQGVCWDLENNIAFNVEVKRKITKADGSPFTDDLIVVASNACCAIALRNAIFKTIPMAITARIQNDIKDIIVGKLNDFETTRRGAVNYFINLGIKEKIDIKEKTILDLFNKREIEDLDRDDILDLRGIATAIKDGDTTLESAFSVAHKTNNTLSKASKILSKPIEEGDADFEKTNIVTTKIESPVKIEVAKVTAPVKETSKASVKKEQAEKEVEFGSDDTKLNITTEAIPIDNPAPVSEIETKEGLETSALDTDEIKEITKMQMEVSHLEKPIITEFPKAVIKDPAKKKKVFKSKPKSEESKTDSSNISDISNTNTNSTLFDNENN